jgi:hypothetical protein
MTETAPNSNRFRVFVLVLTLLNTLFAATLSGLQVDANIRAAKANRDSQYLRLLLADELAEMGLRSAYDFELYASTVQYFQQSLAMEQAALDFDIKGDSENAARLRSQSKIDRARFERGTSLSRIYRDPRYAPADEMSIPNWKAYLADQLKPANDLLARQRAATDVYHKWNKKADAYVAVLTIVAIAFFLLGLAQSTTHLRLFFAASALGIMSIAAVWTGLIIIL